MDADDLFDEGSLEKVEPSLEASAKSLKMAKNWLRRAKDSNILGYKDMTVLASFISMFHAAKAIMLKDGVREKEDRVVAEYVRRAYPELKEHATSLDQYWRLASAIQRDPEISVDGSDAKGALNSAKGFIKFVERSLKPPQ